jgi:hypothetical protein
MSRGSKPGPRPQTWITGPDPLKHTQYRAFVQQRNQARWRKETWPDEFDFDSWVRAWADRWPDRGRSPDQYCMTRIDRTQPWTETNVQVITRAQHALQSGKLGGHQAKANYDQTNI